MAGKIIFGEQQRRVRDQLFARRSVVSDAIHSTRIRRNTMRKMAEAMNAAYLLIYCQASDETIWKRWQENQANPTRHHVPAERVNKVLQIIYKPPSQNEPHVVYRSELDDLPTWMREKGILLD